MFGIDGTYRDYPDSPDYPGQITQILRLPSACSSFQNAFFSYVLISEQFNDIGSLKIVAFNMFILHFISSLVILVDI